MTLTEFIEQEKIQINQSFGGKDDSGWEHFAWDVELLNMQGRHTLTTTELANPATTPRYSLVFKKGMAHQGFYNPLTKKWREATQKEIKDDSFRSYKRLRPIPPLLMEVISHLHLACTTIETTPLFPDYCENLGYSSDSMKAKEIYDAGVETYRKLRKFFGNKFREFLACENDY